MFSFKKCAINVSAVLLTTLGPRVEAGIATSLMQTAPVIPTQEYEVKLQSDIIFNHGGGLNISPHFRTGIVDNVLDAEAYFGSGKTDFMMGAGVKYNLLPDIDGQVGLSFLGGLSLLRDDFANQYYNILVVHLGALVSKSFAVNFGYIVPYAAFQIEPFFSYYDNFAPITIVAGAEWIPEKIKPWSFYSELSVSVLDSLNAVSLGAAYKF